MKKVEIDDLKGAWYYVDENVKNDSCTKIELIIKDKWKKQKREQVIGFLSYYYTDSSLNSIEQLEVPVEHTSPDDDNIWGVILLGELELLFQMPYEKNGKKYMVVKILDKDRRFEKLI